MLLAIKLVLCAQLTRALQISTYHQDQLACINQHSIVILEPLMVARAGLLHGLHHGLHQIKTCNC
jgi:hypothetical protein